jgi:hypothetical protein
MTDQQINTAIAKACEWKPKRQTKLTRTGHFKVSYENPPNYCTDLNAMHEAEKVLKSFEHLINYHALLGYCGGTTLVRLHECITATARQRAEAFLRTLGKWEVKQ